MSWFPPAIASAQESGIVVDRNSPAGKEYALPLDTARRDAAGASDSPVAPNASSASKSPLFGHGVSREVATPTGVPAAKSTGAKKRATKTEKRASSASSNTGTAAAPSSAATAPDRPATDAGDRLAMETAGGGSSTALIGGGLGALLIVALGGAALRAVRDPEDS
jgi:hypothetical protein